MDFKDFLKNSYSERNLALSVMTRDARKAFLSSLAKKVGKEVFLKDILALQLDHRVEMTPDLLMLDPTFRLDVKEKLLLEIKTSGGGLRGKDREYLEIEKGVHSFGFKRAALLMDLYGPEAEIQNQRGKVDEWKEDKVKK